jgi:hypothetical protein
MKKSLEECFNEEITLQLDSGKTYSVTPVPVVSPDGAVFLSVKDPEDKHHSTLTTVVVRMEDGGLEMVMGNFEPSDVKYDIPKNRFVHWTNPFATREVRKELLGKLADSINKEDTDEA